MNYVAISVFAPCKGQANSQYERECNIVEISTKWHFLLAKVCWEVHKVCSGSGNRAQSNEMQWHAGRRSPSGWPKVLSTALHITPQSSFQEHEPQTVFVPPLWILCPQSLQKNGVQPKTNMNQIGKNQPSNPKRLFAFLQRPFVSLGIIAGVATGIALLANAQQPVLKISDLGGNQYSVLITNAGATNYTLFWVPALNTPGYEWQVLTVGNIGESNFIINGGEWNSGFFRAMLGSDFDGDGVPESHDAQPQNPAVGILSVTIDNPLNGSSFD